MAVDGVLQSLLLVVVALGPLHFCCLTGDAHMAINGSVTRGVKGFTVNMEEATPKSKIAAGWGCFEIPPAIQLSKMFDDNPPWK